VKERAISLRLDAETQRALRTLTRHGVSRSQAIRQAIIDAARNQRDLAAEAAALAADEVDRAEAAEVTALMESLRAPG
jgi:hypothetical protein